MTNPQLFDSHMYTEVIRQYEEVAELINLDPNIRERLKHPQRALIVTFPFRRDEYEDDEGRLYLHFNEDIEHFIQNYKFLNFGTTCCQGRGISIESDDN